MENNEKVAGQSIQRDMQKLRLITTPGSIALGLGAYGQFVAHGNAFHPLLNNEKVVWGLLAFGVVTIVWGAYKVRKITASYKQQSGSADA